MAFHDFQDLFAQIPHFQKNHKESQPPTTTTTTTTTITKPIPISQHQFKDPEINQLIQKFQLKLKPPRIIRKDQIKYPHELTLTEKFVYNEIILNAKDEQGLQHLKNIVEYGPLKNQDISGRLIDALMTKYPIEHSVTYYLDTSTEPPKYIKPQELDHTQIKYLKPFNISASYQTQMKMYTKTYFDPFGRGVKVYHPLSNGSFMVISLCKFAFFHWANYHGVFHYLQDHLPDILTVKKKIGKKRKRNDHFTSAWCPPPKIL